LPLMKSMGVAGLDKIRLILGTGLKAKMARGVLIFGSGTVTDRGLKFIRNIILARILASEEFGLMAIVMVAPTVFEMFTQVGVNHSVIQSKRGSDSEYLNAAWWVQAIQSLVLFVVGILLSPLISSFYNKPQLLNLLRVAFLVILFRGFVSPRMNVLRKEHKYGRVVLLSLGSGVIGTFVAIALAFVVQNVWALVIGLVSEAAILCVMSYVLVPFMPRLGVERKSLSELMRFVLGLLGSPVLVAIAVRADVVLLGKLVTEQRLGLYSLAMQLAYLPAILSDNIIRPVLLPGFSERQDDTESLRRGFLKLSQMGVIFGTALAAFMVGCAGNILLLAYGPEYAAVAVPFAVLRVCALIRMLSGIVVPVYMALGRPHVHRRFAALRAAIVLCLMYPAIVMFDLVGAAGVVLLANIITLCFQVYFIRGLVGLKFSEYIACWVPGLLVCSVVFGTKSLLHFFGIQSTISIMVLVGLSSVIAGSIGFFSSNLFPGRFMEAGKILRD